MTHISVRVNLKTLTLKVMILMASIFGSEQQLFRTFDNSVESRTNFIHYDKNNKETTMHKCLTDVKHYSMIVPGYTETCDTFWVKELRQNLLVHRGGCIICMNYSEYNKDYAYLLTHFKNIAKLLTEKIWDLRDKGFRPTEAFFFGFSFGARLITRAGIDYGPKQLGTIHLCDPAGPGFDIHQPNVEPRIAAIHSQCIHTNSKGRGTEERTCDWNWHMGNCGESQAASGPKPLGHHGLCPVFYNMAFRHKFMAVDKSRTCHTASSNRDLSNIPSDGIRMGYFQKVYNTTSMKGINLYAITKREPPYC